MEKLRDHADNRRVRQRAHAVLLSYRKTSIKELVKIFDSNRTTIRSWLDRWDADSFDGLADKQRPGAPAKLSEQEQQRAIELIEENPQSSQAALARLKKETGKEISINTLKRLARKNGLVWKRMRKSLRNQRDQKNFAAAKGIEKSSG